MIRYSVFTEKWRSNHDFRSHFAVKMSQISHRRENRAWERSHNRLIRPQTAHFNREIYAQHSSYILCCVGDLWADGRKRRFKIRKH